MTFKRLYLSLSFFLLSVAKGEKKSDIDRNRYPRKTSSRADDLGRRRFCDDTRPWLIVERINERHTVGSSGFGWFANRSFNRTQRHPSHSLALWSVSFSLSYFCFLSCSPSPSFLREKNDIRFFESPAFVLLSTIRRVSFRTRWSESEQQVENAE